MVGEVIVKRRERKEGRREGKGRGKERKQREEKRRKKERHPSCRTSTFVRPSLSILSKLLESAQDKFHRKANNVIITTKLFVTAI